MAFTNTVRAIPLASSATGGGVSAVVTGWGAIDMIGQTVPNQLQALDTFTMTNPECRAQLTPSNAEFVFDHKICAFTRGGQGICQGDSGGPLVAGGAVIGTVSWNIPCARHFPDAYDRVFFFRNWILANTS